VIVLVRFGLAAILVASAACRQPLPHAQPSIDALVEDVLTALEHRDAARLRHLAVSEIEFREAIWPELPAARPERNLTAAYVWGDQHTRSEAGLQSAIADYGGKTLNLVRLEFRGETTQHRTFLVRRDPAVVVRGTDAQEQTLRLFGSIVEHDGGFKIFSYNVD
jgi:hypothetical protein